MISEISSVYSILLTIIWQSTLFLFVGLVISFILRRHSARAHQVLLLSIIVAVIVPMMAIMVKHLGLGIFEAKQIEIQVPASVPESEPVYTETFENFFTKNIKIQPPAIDKIIPPAVEIKDAKNINWQIVLFGGWITVSLILTVRLLVTFLLGVRLLSHAEPLDSERITKALHDAIIKLGVRKKVTLYGSRKIKSPVIWCWRKNPVLLVPKDAGRFHERIYWPGVLSHELAHWKRRDHICGLIAELAVCVLPWQLLLWWAKTRMLNMSEQACDDWVIATGKTGTDYVESLLDLTPGGQMAFVPAVVREKNGLAARVQRILKNSCSNPRTGILWALTACLIACSIAVTVAFAQTRPAAYETAKSGNFFEGKFETNSDIPVKLETGQDGTKKIITAKSIRFERNDSEIKPSLTVDYRRGKGFVWQATIELLDANNQVIGKQQTKPSGEGITSGQPIVIERQIEFLPFKSDEVINARKFRISYEQLEPLRDEIGRLYNEEETQWIQGRVTDFQGQPVADAVILINEHKPDADSIRIARIATDDNGYYKFAAVEWPYKIGVEWQRGAVTSNTEHFDVINLKPILFEQNKVDFKFEMFKEQFEKGSASISGKVTDQSGNIIKDYEVSLIQDTESQQEDDSAGDYNTYFWINRQVNNEEGTFHYEDLPTGKYKIWIIPDDKQRYEWPQKQVELAANETAEVVIEATSKHKLFGRVLFEDNSPAIVKPAPWPGAKTSIIMPLGGLYAAGIGTVDKEGYFVIYLEQYEYDELKAERNKLHINIPSAEEHSQMKAGEFPFDLLSENKETAGVIKINRPESSSKPIEMYTQIFEILNRDPKEILELLEIILKEQTDTESSSDLENELTTLVPVPDKNYIIARASAKNMELIEKWIKLFDNEFNPVSQTGSLSEIEDKDNIVQKFYYLEHSTPSQIAQIIEPMLSDKGYVGAEDNTSTVFVIDKVSNLLRIEQIINMYDVKQGHPANQIFELKYINSNKAAEIINKIFELVLTQLTNDTTTIIPIPERNWLIITSSPADMKLIADLIEVLDFQISQKEQTAIRTFKLKYTSPEKMSQIVRFLLGTNGRVSADEKTQSLAIIDTLENLTHIEKLIVLLDVPEIDSDDTMVNINTSSIRINDIVKWLLEWTGKSVILSNEAKNIKIETFSPYELPRSKAIKVLYSAIREAGFVVEETEDIIFIKPAIPNREDEVQQLDPDKPLEDIQDKDTIVRKIFRLNNYSPSTMGQIILPLLDSSGQVTADENTKTLIVMDTVSTLIRIEKIIEQFDVSNEKQPITEIFQLRYITPDKAMEILNKLFELGITQQSFRGTTIVPEAGNNFLIIRSSPENMELIKELLEILDEPINPQEYNASNHFANIYEIKSIDPSRFVDLIKFIFKNTSEIRISFFSPGYSTYLNISAYKPELDKIEKLLSLLDVPIQNSSEPEDDSDQIGPPDNEFIITNPEMSQPKNSNPSNNVLETSEDNSVHIDSPNGSLVVNSAPRSHMEIIQLTHIDTEKAVKILNEMMSSIDPEKVKLIIQPFVKNNQLILFGDKEIIQMIKKAFEQIDTESLANTPEYDTIVVRYIDVDQAVETLINTIKDMGSDYERNISIQPLPQTRQLLVFGKKQYRDIVKTLLKEMDLPSSQLIRKTFQLKYADPEEIKVKLDELFHNSHMSSGQNNRTLSSDTLITTSYPSLRQITVYASEENMEKIQQLINQWDRPTQNEEDDSDQIGPPDDEFIIDSSQDSTSLEPAEYDIIAVRYADVDEIAEILMKTIEEMGNDSEKNISIQPLPQTRQLLVFGKKQYRDIVKTLLKEMDLPSSQLIRQTFQLKYADPEEIKVKLDELFHNSRISSGQNSQTLSSYTVITTTYPSLGQIVVIASGENLEKIKQLINQWDVPTRNDEEISSLQSIQQELIIRGLCVDSENKPIPNAHVYLYCQDYNERSLEITAQAETDFQGNFTLEPVPAFTEQDLGRRNYFLFMPANGHAAAWQMLNNNQRGQLSVKLIAGPSSTIIGRILTEDSKPIANAQLWIRQVIPPGANEYDMESFADEFHTIAPVSGWSGESSTDGSFSIEGVPEDTRIQLVVRHPDFAQSMVYVKPETESNIILEPAAIITGRVLYGKTKQPAPNVRVQFQGIENHDSAYVLTNQQGQYRFESVRPDKYNIWAESEGLTSVALDSFEVKKGQTKQAPDLHLIEGGFITGKVIDALTGKPVKPGASSDVAIYGPSRPSGAGVEISYILEDGSYKIRVAPGRNNIYLRPMYEWGRENAEVTPENRWVNVDEGQTVEVNFEIRKFSEQEKTEGAQPREQIRRRRIIPRTVDEIENRGSTIITE